MPEFPLVKVTVASLPSNKGGKGEDSLFRQKIREDLGSVVI